MHLRIGLWWYLAWSRLRQSFVADNLHDRAEQKQISKTDLNAYLGLKLPPRPAGKVIWFHAPDVEQLNAFNALKVAISDYLPEAEFLFTTETPISDAQDLEPDVIYQTLPRDHPRFVRRFIQTWSPDAGVWATNALYPALMSRVAGSGIPIIYANAELTRRQMQRYSWIPSFISSYFGCFARILLPSDTEARRLRWLRVPRRKLEVVGQMSAGAIPLPYDEDARVQFSAALKNRTVWFASHVETSELATLAKVQKRISRSAGRALLILHIAHGTNANSARTRLEALGLNVSSRAADQFPPAMSDVFLVEEAHELGMYYRLAPASFIGGSMTGKGGNDPFEAAALGSAILHGPHVATYQNIYDRLADANATIEVSNSDKFVRALLKALAPDEAARMAHAAWEVSSASAIVTDRILELLSEYLDFEVIRFDEDETHEAA